jgi:DNA-binding MarR family transcriptional regulator
MTTAPALTTREIGMTENAFRALLLANLEGTPLDYHRWVALLTVATQGPLPHDAVVGQLHNGLKLDVTAATSVVAGLVEDGLIEVGDAGYTTTESGATLFGEVGGKIRSITQEIFSGLDNEDLAVASRVLTQLTERANAELARHQAQ